MTYTKGNRNRIVTRCPKLDDAKFKRSIPIGLDPNTGLLNNRNPDIKEGVITEGPKNVKIGGRRL